MRAIICCLLLLVFPFMLTAQWLCPWKYRMPITLTENSGSNLSNYQMRIDVAYQSGMNADFSDLRFTTSDGTTPVDFWVETYTASSTAIVWLELPGLTASSSTDFYLYYENIAASSASDAAATFIFFDDFSVWSGWNDYGSGNVVQNTSAFPGVSVLAKTNNCDPNGGYKLLGTSIAEFRLIAREIRQNEGGNDCGLNRYGLENSSYNGYNINRSADNNGNNNRPFGFERRTSGSGNNSVQSNYNQPRNNWYRTELKRCSQSTNNITANLYSDDRSPIGTVTGTNLSYSSFDRITVRGGRPYYFDFIAVGNYTCTEPTYVFGAAEEDLSNPVITVNEDSGLLSNDGELCIGDAAVLTTTTSYFSYLWSDGSTSSSLTVNVGGNYALTVVDAYGCEKMATITLIDFPKPQAGTCNLVHDYCMENTGQIYVEASNGTPPYTISWTPNVGSSSTNTITLSGGQLPINNIPGNSNLDILVIDANGCTPD